MEHFERRCDLAGYVMTSLRITLNLIGIGILLAVIFVFLVNFGMGYK